MKSFDLVVIGSGPGGYVGAIRAAQLGMRVAIVEEDELGGVCLNWGCIPTKCILDSAEHYEAVKRGVPGLVVEGLSADWGAVIDASRKVAKRLNAGVKSLMKKNQIEVIQGRGRLGGGRQVVVSDGAAESVVEGEQVLLATGSTEFVFPGVEVDGKRVLTSREALESRDFPRSIAVVGGGAVGVEFAYAYASYGSQVTVVEMEDQLLPGMEREVAETLAKSFERRGIEVATSTAYKALEVGASDVVLTVEGERGERELRAEQALFAVGREERGLARTWVHRGRGRLPNERPRRMGDRRLHRGPDARTQGVARGCRRGRVHGGAPRASRKSEHDPGLHLLPATGRRDRAHRSPGAGTGP